VSVRILAFDTTSESGSVALVDDGVVAAEILIESTEGYSPILFGKIKDLLDGLDWTLASIDCFAAASGPGSFTGVRVGLTAAKGLGEAAGKPVVAVSNLEAIAALGTTPVRAPLIDAHRVEIYGAVYDARLQIIREPLVAPLDKWLEAVPPGAEFLTTGFSPAIQPLRIVGPALAGAIGQIAHTRMNAGLACDPVAIEAQYVRRSDAELLWKE
jgi:tRNA threonylcarbamoyladenosine biosynthesis protein TsaB